MGTWWFRQSHLQEQKKLSPGRLLPQLFPQGVSPVLQPVSLGLCFNAAFPKVALAWPGSRSSPQSQRAL